MSGSETRGTKRPWVWGGTLAAVIVGLVLIYSSREDEEASRSDDESVVHAPGGRPHGGDEATEPAGTERRDHSDRESHRPATAEGSLPADVVEEWSGEDEDEDEDEATNADLAAERAEEIRRPLGGLALEMIPPAGTPMAVRTEATQELYNRGQEIAAREAALALLEEDGTNEDLIRIVVSTACMDGIVDLARTHYARLPGQGQREMRLHCLRHGTVLDELFEADDEAALDEFLVDKGDDWDPARTALPASEAPPE